MRSIINFNDIRYTSILIITVIAANVCEAQNKFASAEKVHDKSSLFRKTSFNFSDNDAFKKLVGLNGNKIILDNGVEYQILESEEYVFHGNDFYITQAINGTHTKLVKRVQSNGEIFHLEIGQEQTIMQIDNAGRFLVIDFAHGAGNLFLFYDEKLNEFFSYDHYYEMLQSYIDSNNVYLYTRPSFYGDSASLVNIGLDDLDIKSTTFYVGRTTATQLVKINDKICLLLKSGREHKSDIITYSPDFSQTSTFQFLNENTVGIINPDHMNNAIIYRKRKTLTSIDLESGKTKWQIPVDTEDRVLSFVTTPSGQYLEARERQDETNYLAVYETEKGILKGNIELTELSSGDDMHVLKSIGENNVIVFSGSKEPIRIKFNTTRE